MAATTFAGRLERSAAGLGLDGRAFAERLFREERVQVGDRDRPLLDRRRHVGARDADVLGLEPSDRLGEDRDDLAFGVVRDVAEVEGDQLPVSHRAGFSTNSVWKTLRAT